MRIGLVLGASLVLHACSGAPVEPVEPNRANLSAEIRRALDPLLERAHAAPGEADSHGNLGLFYYTNALWPEASKSFASAARLDPDEPHWRYYEAITLKEMGEFPRSLEILRALATEHPELAALQHRLGHWLLLAGEIDAAAAAFQRTKDVDSSSPAADLGLASVALEREQYQEAAAILEGVLASGPPSKLASYNLGLALRGLGRTEEASVHLSRGLGAKTVFLPDAMSARIATMILPKDYNALALSLVESGRAPEAVELLEKGLQSRPEDVQLLNNLAYAYMRMNRTEAALAVLERALTHDAPEFVAVTHINLAGCLLSLGRKEEAVEFANRAIEEAPTLGQAHFIRARVAIAMGSLEDAMEFFLTASRLDSRKPSVHLDLGDTAMKLGRKEEARDHFRTAARLLPDLARAHVALASVDITLGDLEEAEHAIATLRRIAPRHRRLNALEQRLSEARNP